MFLVWALCLRFSSWTSIAFFFPPQSLAKSKNSVGPWRLTGKPNPSTVCPGLTMALPPCICFRISLHNVCTALKAVEGFTE